MPLPVVPSCSPTRTRLLRQAARWSVAPLLALALHSGTASVAAPVEHNVMPAPAEAQFDRGRLAITSAMTVAVQGHDDERLQGAIGRALRRWEERTGFVFTAIPRVDAELRAPAVTDSAATLVIACDGPGLAIPAVEEDESYTLTIDERQAKLRAPTVVGAMRGLETFLQLLQSDATEWFVPTVQIRDRPRFPWRGLMIDVCRHWQPMEVIKRNLDGMALVKLNVLHLHLTEDQGFRIESKTYPRLHEFGSDGKYFTHDDIREIIAYATARGIRVMPEFDIPGHATSWVVGHPEFASLPGPYQIERRWGIFDPTLDPTNEKVYEMLDAFLGEMAALFPDAYLHIGGDEVNGKQWNANPRIQEFIRQHNLENNEGLQAYFNQRVQAIVAKHGKRMIGWDEIFHPNLPKDTAIHSWRGYESLAAAAQKGYTGILSNGYYIDLIHPASQHYANDPLPASTTLSPEEQRRILGGEATMWSEWVTPETIDSRIWPRTAAIAERLWSPREVNDETDMYRRLAVVSQRLEEAGLNHDRNLDAMLRRFAGDGANTATLHSLRTFIDAVEPVKVYRRGRAQKGSTQFTPLTGLADCARPDSASSRELSWNIQHFLFAPTGREAAAAAVTQQFTDWIRTSQHVREELAPRSPRVTEALPLVEALANASDFGLAMMQQIERGPALTEDAFKAKLAELTQATTTALPAEVPFVPALRLLAAGAFAAPERATLSPEAWRDRVETLAAPPKPPARPASSEH